MAPKFKPLAGQVIVVSGAASGLGLAVAGLAAKAGAAVVLAAADERSVRAECEEIAAAGGRVHPVACDLAAEDGCDRVARAAVARFGRIDSWIEADGGEAVLPRALKAMMNQRGEREEPAALVSFCQKPNRAMRGELKAAKGKVAATLVRLPKEWRHDDPAQAAAEAALHALTRPMGEMALAAKGTRLTVETQARKHPGVLVSVGLLAVAGATLWFNRGRIAKVATAAASATSAAVKPRLARAGHRATIAVVKRRPLQVARLVAKHPRPALKLARALH